MRTCFNAMQFTGEIDTCEKFFVCNEQTAAAAGLFISNYLDHRLEFSRDRMSVRPVLQHQICLETDRSL